MFRLDSHIAIPIKKGNSRLKTDTSFVYLFPLAQGKVVRVNKMVSLDNFMGKEGEKRITGLGFSTTAGDTIFAARGGLVTEVVDNSASTSENTSFHSTENYLEVFHKDGTFARYKLFQNEGIFVSPGEEVIPGRRLASLAERTTSRVPIYVSVFIAPIGRITHMYLIFIFLPRKQVNLKSG